MRAPSLLPSLLSVISAVALSPVAMAADAAVPAPAVKSPSTSAPVVVAPPDTTAPTISTLTATLDPAVPPTATQAAIAVTWAASDTGFAEGTLELSTDGGATYTAAKTVGDHGTASLTVVRLAATSTVFVRLIAKDAAGNRATSAAQAVEIPGTVDPEKALETAVSALPPLATIAPPPPAAKPDAPAGTTPAPEAEAVVVPEGSVLAGAPLLKEPAPAVPAGTVAEPAPGTTPATPTKPGATPAKSAAPAVILAPSMPAAKRTTARTLATPAGGFLQGAAATKALDEARADAAKKDVDGALARYVRLIDSDQAATAVTEALDLLAADGDPATIVALADTLPPELKSEAVRLHLGNAYLALTQPAEAEAAVARIRKTSPLLRQALLVIAKARFAQGKLADYTRLIERLATGDDAVAAEATALRGK